MHSIWLLYSRAAVSTGICHSYTVTNYKSNNYLFISGSDLFAKPGVPSLPSHHLPSFLHPSLLLSSLPSASPHIQVRSISVERMSFRAADLRPTVKRYIFHFEPKIMSLGVVSKWGYGDIFSIHFLNVFPVGKRPQYTDHFFSQYKKTAAYHAQ